MDIVNVVSIEETLCSQNGLQEYLVEDMTLLKQTLRYALLCKQGTSLPVIFIFMVAAQPKQEKPNA